MKTSCFRQWVVLSALALTPTTPLSAEVLANGGFEHGYSGWEAGGNVSLQSAPPYGPTEGSWLNAFNASDSAPNGSLRKGFAVVPGKRYLLQFDVGNLSYNSNHQRLQVIVENNVSIPPPPGARAPYINETIDIAGPGRGATAWVEASYEFTAEQSQLRIVFNDVSTSTVALDLVLDHIRITQLPEAPVLLVNGGFENDLAGWNSGGNLRVQSSPPYVPAEGAKLLSFNAGNSAPNGFLQQNVAVLAGHRYRLEFEAGNLSYNTLHQKLHVQVKETINHSAEIFPLADNIDIPGPGGGATAWVSARYEFVASTNSIELAFVDISTATSALDLVLDHVRLTEVPSENRVINGGFELGFASWSVNSLSNVGIQDSAPYTPTEGTKLLSFNDQNRAPLANVSQTISVVPGTQFRVEFDAGNLAYNRSGQRMRVSVFEYVNSVLHMPIQKVIDLSAPSVPGTTRWTHQSHVFTPQTDTVTLVFDDLSVSTFSVDMVLDAVSVIPVP